MVGGDDVEITEDWRTEYEEMLRRYDIYDRTVDIVSAFEALFTIQLEISATVESFDRYPSLSHPDGRRATPDFAVTFVDGRVLLAEIANLGLHEHSVDSLCRQLDRYDHLHTPNVPHENLDGVPDVLCLVPTEDVNDAVDRIIGERMAVADHAYNPRRPPVLAGFSRSAERYAFLRNRDPRNGVLRHERLHAFINGGYKAPPDYWTPIKAEEPFANDPVPDLYLATQIWIKVLPTMAEGQVEFSTTVQRIAEALRRQYGLGRIQEVRAALAVLERGGLVRSGERRDDVIIKRIQLRLRGGEQNFPHVLAERACRPRALVATPRRRAGLASPARPTIRGQAALFNVPEDAT
jgi:hypothetical protein